MSMLIPNIITDDNFKEFIAGKNSLIVVSQLWCLTCKEIIPKLVELDDEYRDKINIGMLMLDSCPTFIKEHLKHIDVVPSCFFYEAGELKTVKPGSLFIQTNLEEFLKAISE